MADSSSSSHTFPKKTNKPTVKLWANTRSKEHNIHFSWSIHNFSSKKSRLGLLFQSPTFSDSDDDIKWCLKLYRRERHLVMFLNFASEPDRKEVDTTYKLSVLNAELEKTITKTSTRILKFSETSDLTSALFLNIDLLEIKCGFLVQDELKYVCEVSYASEISNVSNQKSNEQFDVSECNLFDDLGSLLENKKFSDVILMVGEHQFPAHKAILAARSDVFAAMFEHDMQESKLGRVTIVDVDQEVVQEMLRFIYTGKAPNLKKMAAELFMVADKYQLKKLKGMCQQAMFDGLSIETAAKTLVLANQLNADQLKEQTMQFIKIHGKDVIKTKGWQDMIHANDISLLLGETFEALFK